MKKILISGLVLSLSILAASESQAKAKKSLDLVKYDLKLELDEKKPTPSDVKKLVEDINAGKEVSFKQVTDLLIRENSDLFVAREIEANGKANSRSQNIDLFRSTLKEHNEYISSLVKGIKNKNYLSLKSQYEKRILTLNESELTYNKLNNTTLDIQKNSKMQCDSGTNLNLILSRKLSNGESYRKGNRVVIISASHVQPGHIKKIADQNNLISIETTAKGDAVKLEGPINQLQGCMKIVDADSYVLADALSRYLTSSNKKSLVNEIITQTAKKYEFSSYKLTRNCGAEQNESLASILSRKYVEKSGDESLFDVDETKEIPEGDIKREEIKENTVAAINASIAKQNKAHASKQARIKKASKDNASLSSHGLNIYGKYTDNIESCFRSGRTIHYEDIDTGKYFEYTDEICKNMIDYHLQKGMSINTSLQVSHGTTQTPILLASLSIGRPDLSKHIIERGANINIKDEQGNIALHYAVAGYNAIPSRMGVMTPEDKFLNFNDTYRKRTNTQLELISLLIKRGIDINSMNTNRVTPLAISIVNGEYDLACYLIEQGADVKLLTSNYYLNYSSKLEYTLEYCKN